ncbi:unnamed protein product [Brachionus calyciflorus]|uniref:Snake toxin/toxin-like domain-containing protein n=1 Tax=Brachionus calyciflorus TaxID=104777 RepID=A0A814RWG3_9BILA|nr:unnamed protein product [Brachionus calyciflorus]
MKSTFLVLCALMVASFSFIKCIEDPTPKSSSTPSTTSTTKKSSIECFTCVNCPGSSGATTKEEIKSCDGYCTKAVASVKGITSIIKECSSICVEAEVNGGKLSCCKTDKCNGAETITLNSILSILTLSVIYGFLKF